MSSFAEEKISLKNDIYKMGMKVVDMLIFSMEILEHAEEKDLEGIQSRYKKIQKEQYLNEEKVSSITAKYTASEEEVRDIVAAVRISVHLERIAARSLNIAFMRERESIKDLKEDFQKVKKMLEKCVDLFIVIMESYRKGDRISAKKNLFKDLEIISAYQRFNIRISTKMKKNPENIDKYIKLINLNRDIERLASHIMNISTWIYYLMTGEHILLDNVRE